MYFLHKWVSFLVLNFILYIFFLMFEFYSFRSPKKPTLLYSEVYCILERTHALSKLIREWEDCNISKNTSTIFFKNLFSEFSGIGGARQLEKNCHFNAHFFARWKIW